MNFGAGGNITGDFTVGTLVLTSNNTYTLQASRTMNVTNNIVFNSVCFGGVALQSSTAGTQAFIIKASGIVSGQNLTLKDINVSGGATFNAFASTNQGNNTGWNFVSSPTLGAIGAITQNTNVFSVSAVTGAVQYNWTAPAGMVIISGQGTNSITLQTNNLSGQLCVVATNGCGATTSSVCITLASDYIPLNTLGVFVSEDFNTLANTASSSTFPVGWRILETGTNANTTYTASNGSVTAGDSYSFGTTGSTSRTLGGLQSGSLIPSYGAKFLNNTTSTATSITVLYTGETWRVGAVSRTDKLDFQYSLNATDLSNGLWLDIDSLDYQNIAQGATSSGSLIHSSLKNFTFTGLNIPAGSFFWIRWLDINATGSDDGMGINDFSIKPCGTITPPTTLAQSLCGAPSVTNLSATGTGINWYNTNTGGAALAQNSPIVSGTYYASQTISGCESARSAATITVVAAPSVSAGINQTVCAGTAVTLSGSGATTYAWNNSVNNAVAFTPTSTATYTVTGTDANGCSNTAQATVTVNAAPSVSAGINQTVCAGTAVTLSGSGATTYAWNNSVNNAVAFTPTTTTTYTVTGTAANGCSNTAQATVTVNAAPSVSAGINQTVCAGTAVTLSGSGATTYAWNNSVNNAVAFTPTSTATYTVTGTNANGCSNTAQATVTVNAVPSVSAGSNQTVCAGTAVTLSGSGATTYAWNNSVNNAVSFTPTTTTTYTVTGTDANGCSNTAQATVTVNAAPSVSAGSNQTVCAGTAVTLSGSGATTYAWNNSVNNAVAFTPTSTATYTVTGTDANGCSNTAQATVTVNAAPSVSAGINQTVCAGTAVTLSGSGATTYTWNNSVNNAIAFTPTSTTTYTVTGTDANGCSNTAQATVTVNAAPSVSAGINQTVCAGTAVTLSGSGATTYAWNNSVNNAIAFTPSSTTTYTVTGTDANGCSNTAQATVTVNAVPIVSAGNQTVCAGTAVTLSGSGATTYAWNNGVINAVAFTPTTTTTYTVTGTNANGCSNTAQATVTVNAAPSVSAGGNQTVCAGTAVTLIGSGATTYVWNNNVNNAVAFTPTSTATYTVTGTNANGCINTAQATVTVNAAPSVSAGSNQTVCAGTAVILSGSGATTYAWNNGVSNAVPFTPTVTTIYTVTGTATNGCSNTAQATITVNAAPSVSAGSNQTVCSGTAVTLSGSGATTYTWNNGVSNAVPFTPTSTTTYTVTGTAANGCSNTAQTTITVNSIPTVSGGADVSICSGESVVLSGNGANTYSWSNGIQNGQAFVPTVTGVYTVTGTNSFGCIDSDVVNVFVNSSSTSNLTEVACISYVLNGQTYNQSGIYSQIIPNAFGCDSMITLNLTLNLPPAIPVVSSTSSGELFTNSEPNNSYQWIFCGSGLAIANETDTMYVPNLNGQFAVTAINSCGTTTSDCITIDNVGIDGIEVNLIGLYPNPTFGSVYLSGDVKVGTHYELTDAQGRVISFGDLLSEKNINLFGLTTGIYWIKLDGHTSLKVLKQ